MMKKRKRRKLPPFIWSLEKTMSYCINDLSFRDARYYLYCLLKTSYSHRCIYDDIISSFIKIWSDKESFETSVCNSNVEIADMLLTHDPLTPAQYNEVSRVKPFYYNQLFAYRIIHHINVHIPCSNTLMKYTRLQAIFVILLYIKIPPYISYNMLTYMMYDK